MCDFKMEKDLAKYKLFLGVCVKGDSATFTPEGTSVKLTE